MLFALHMHEQLSEYHSCPLIDHGMNMEYALWDIDCRNLLSDACLWSRVIFTCKAQLILPIITKSALFNLKSKRILKSFKITILAKILLFEIHMQRLMTTTSMSLENITLFFLPGCPGKFDNRVTVIFLNVKLP